MFWDIFGNDDNEDEPTGPPVREQQANGTPSSTPRRSPEHSSENGQKNTHTREISPEQRASTPIPEPDDPNAPDYAVEFDPSTSEGQMGRELQIQDTRGSGPYAGEWPRNMFESAYHNPTQATWVGYQSDPQEGLREVPISHNSWFRHAAVFGTTGYGKTTFLKNLMVQWAYAGWGFCFIDPKGDGVMDLMKELPDHRLDDVIWIDPGSETHDRVVGINFLEPGSTETEIEFQAEVESIIDDLRNIIKNEAYWGPRMDGVLQNFARGMIASDKNYTLIDMYYVLLDEEYRELFVEDVDDPAVKRYTRVIAEEMDQGDLDALLRRLQSFVENRVTREIIAHRESTVNLKDAVEDGKIILVKNDIDSADIKQMIATGVMRRIWAAVKSRNALEEEKRTPFFLIVDEFDDVVSEDANVDKMLSKARSMRMSVTLCNQQPSQLPREIQKSIFGNCDNLLAFNTNAPKDANLIMKRFGKYTAQDLTSLGRFKIFTRISVDHEKSPPFITYTFPDYPPVRTEPEARRAIKKSLQKHGVERLDPVRAVKDLALDTDEYGPETEQAALQAAVERDGDDAEEIDIAEQDVLEAIYALELRGEHDEDGFIPAHNVQDELEHRLDEEFYQSMPAQVVEELDSTQNCKTTRRNNELHVKLTETGRNTVASHDTGSAATGGGNDHRWVLRRAFELFTKAGFIVNLPSQTGSEMPDGIAEIPIDMSASSTRELRRKQQRLEDEYPEIAAVTEDDINLEAETTTIQKPMQTLTNLRKALDADRKCVFCVKDMETESGDIASHAKKGARILLDPPYIAAQDANGNRQFYNKSARMEVEENVYAIRHRNTGHHTQWWETDNGHIELRDRKSGNVISRFDGIEHVRNPVKEEVPAYYRYDKTSNSFIVYENDGEERHRSVYKDKDRFKEDWAPIRPPFIPEAEFPHPPQEDDWDFVVFPDDDKDLPPLKFEPYLTDNGTIEGELTPYLPSDRKQYGTNPLNSTAETPTADSASPQPTPTDEAASPPSTVDTVSPSSSSDREQAAVDTHSDPDIGQDMSTDTDTESANEPAYHVVYEDYNDIYHIVKESEYDPRTDTDDLVDCVCWTRVNGDVEPIDNLDEIDSLCGPCKERTK